MGNKIVHMEFLSKNLGESQNFFGKLFGWGFQGMDESYTLFRTSDEESAVGGGFGTEGSMGKQAAVAYIAVDDIDAKLKEIEAAGGKTTLPKTPLPENFGHIASFTDPHGIA